MRVIKRLDDFILPFSIALFGGFDIAWTLMQNPKYDGLYNVGLAIPAGLIIGLLLGGAKMWLGFRMPRSVTVAALTAVGIFSIMPLFQIVFDPRAASIVVPILIKDGFMAKSVSSAFFFWTALLFLVFGVAWGCYYLLRRRAVSDSK